MSAKMQVLLSLHSKIQWKTPPWTHKINILDLNYYQKQSY